MPVGQTGKNPYTTLDASDTPMRRNSAQAILRRNLTRFAPKMLCLLIPNLTILLPLKHMYALIYAINTTKDGKTYHFNTVPPHCPSHADLIIWCFALRNSKPGPGRPLALHRVKNTDYVISDLLPILLQIICRLSSILFWMYASSCSACCSCDLIKLTNIPVTMLKPPVPGIFRLLL